MAWMNWLTRWFGGTTKSMGSLGVGLKAALSGGAPGGWASDHREETAHNTGFNYIAVHAIAAQIAGATVSVFADGDHPNLRRAQRKYLAARTGTFTRWKSTYGADNRETDPLPLSHPLVRILKRPNPYETGANFRYRQAQQIRLTGSCLIWNVPSISGPPCERYVIPTAMASPVAPTMDLPRGGWRISPVASRYTPIVDDGFVDCPSWYRILGQIVDARQVQVIRLPHAWYLDDGQSPLSAGAKWVDAGEAVDEARFHQLKNGIDPSIVWNLPPDVSPDQDEIDRVQAKISSKYGGPENVGRVIVAQNGTSVTPLSTSPREMCFTEGFHDFKTAILALHQTPPVAVGLQEPGAYAAYNASIKAWRHAAVQPLCDILAEADTEHLAPAFGHGLTIEIESDTVDDSELLEQQLQNDLAARVRTRNEWRAVRGMPPLPGPQGEELVGNESPKPPAQPPADRPDPLPQNGPGPNLLESGFDRSAPQRPDVARHKAHSVTDEAIETPANHSDQAPPPRFGDATAHDSDDATRQRRAELIAEILYGLYGTKAVELVQQYTRTDKKTFDPEKHPRDENGRFIFGGSGDVHVTARQYIRDVLNGIMYSRRDENLLNALRTLPVEELEKLHGQHGVLPPMRERSRLIENILVRLESFGSPFGKPTDEFRIFDHPAPKDVEVYIQQPKKLQKLLSKTFSAKSWGEMVGAQPGARVYVYPKGPIPDICTSAQIAVVHHDYFALRSTSGGIIENRYFEVRPESRRQGIALRVLATQVQGAKRCQFRFLELFAGGYGKKIRHLTDPHEAHLEGYITWPRMGFNGPIEPLLEDYEDSEIPELNEVAKDFRKRFPKVTKIAQLMLIDGGQEWWNDYGGSLELRFDLKRNSVSREILMQRLEERDQGDKKSLSASLKSDQEQSHLPGEDFTEAEVLKLMHPERGENPDPMTKEQEKLVDQFWEEQRKRLRTRQSKVNANDRPVELPDSSATRSSD